MPEILGLDREPDLKMDPAELLEQPKDIKLEELKKGGENFEKLQDKRIRLHDINESDKVDFPDLNEIKSKVEKIRAKDEKKGGRNPL